MGKLSGSVYLIKGYKGDYKENKEHGSKSPTVYLRLRRLMEDLTNSPKRDLNFKTNPCEYLEELVSIYRELCGALKENRSGCSILDSLMYLKKKQFKTTTLSNVIIQDLINTIYGDGAMSSIKYQMINEDWTDMLYQYFISSASKQSLSKDKVYKAIERAPLLDFEVPNTNMTVSTITRYDELAILLDKLGVIETVKIIDILFTKVFIFDL